MNVGLYNSAIDTVSKSIVKNKIEINDSIKKLPYAMQLAEFSGNQSLLVLSHIEGSKLSWVDSSDLGYKTYNGKIISTSAFDNNFELIRYPNIKIILNELKNKSDPKLKTAFIRFTNPNTNFMQISYAYSFVEEGTMERKIDGKAINYILLKEDFDVPLIGWSGSNYYWLDSKDRLIKGKTYIAPSLDKLFFETLKSYSNE